MFFNIDLFVSNRYAGEFCVKVVKVGRVLIGFALQIRAADLALVAVFRRRGDGMRAAV